MSALTPPASLLSAPLECTYSFVGAIDEGRMQDDYLIQRSKSSGGQLMLGGGRVLAENEGVNMDNDDVIDKPVAEYLRRVLGKSLDLEGSEKSVEAVQFDLVDIEKGDEL